jgi:type II secretory pathway pseudopilin PulG
MKLHHKRQQQGFTRVELMISILISTIMLGVAGSQLIGSRTLFALQEADGRIEENARYALEVLTSNIRMASFTDINDGSQTLVTGQFFSRSCDAADFNPCTDDGAGTDPDHFAVWYNPPSTNEVDCSGQALPAANTSSSIANVFYIDADDITGINGLRCRSYAINSSNTASLIAGSQQEIIAGIESMQILYGITDRSYGSSVPIRYVSAGTVNALVDNASLREKWASIMSVRVTILAGTGFSDGADKADSRIFSISDAPPITFTDGNRRKIFSSTVAINNANL